MPPRPAWVIQAYREHHAGRLDLEELARVVREHRGDSDDEHGDVHQVVASCDDVT